MAKIKEPDYVLTIPVVCVVKEKEGEVIQIPSVKLPVPARLKANGMEFELDEFYHNVGTGQKYAQYKRISDIVTATEMPKPADHLGKRQPAPAAP